MKTQLTKKLTLSLFALSVALIGQKAIAAPHELKSSDYLRVTLPVESAETAKLVYGLNGETVEASPRDGDVIKLNAEHDNGGMFPTLGDFSFLGYLDAGNPTIEITTTNPLGFDINIRFSSTGESAYIDAQTPLVLEAPGATVEAVKAGGQDEIQNPAPPIFFTDLAQAFDKTGVLEIRFTVAQPEDEDQGGDGDNAGDDNQDEGLPEFAEPSGGCSMTAGAAASAFNLLGLLPLAGLFGLRRAKK